VKAAHQLKEQRSTDYKDSALILLAVCCVFGLLYLALFFAVSKDALQPEE
jgi:hypothetical protein